VPVPGAANLESSPCRSSLPVDAPCGRDTEEPVGEFNLMLKGWANYFRLGSVSKAYESVDSSPSPEQRQRCWPDRGLDGHNLYPGDYLQRYAFPARTEVRWGRLIWL
jgi:group II intron maturase